MRRPDEDDEAYGDLPDHPVLLITMRQAAELAQVSIHRIREWSLLPGFPVIRTQHMVRIPPRLFEDWLAAQAQQTNTQENVA